MGDPFWHYKVLGLHCDGTNGSKRFVDSVTGKTVIPFGNAQISTAQYPALTGKTSSAYFDGNGDYLSVADDPAWNFGTRDFTVRARIRLTGYAPNNGGSYVATIVSQDLSTSRAFSFGVSGTASSFTTLAFAGFPDNGGGTSVTGSYAFALNTWYLVEACRVGNLLYLFVDGTLLNTGGTAYSVNQQNSTTALKIGASLYNATYLYYLTGYISEVEIYNGIGLHTASYTPGSDPFVDGFARLSGTTKDASDNFASRLVRVYHRESGDLVGTVVSNGTTGAWAVDSPRSGEHVAIAYDGTANDISGRLLAVPYSGANNSTTAEELSGGTVELLAGAKITTAFADPFGGYGGVLELPSTAAASVIRKLIGQIGAAGDFHLRAWVYRTANTTGNLFVGADASASNPTSVMQWQFDTASSIGMARALQAWDVTSTTLPALNTWVCVQVRRTGNTLALFNGATQTASVTQANSYADCIGAGLVGGFTGYACDLEILPYADSVAVPTARMRRRTAAPTENAIIYDNITPV